MSRTAFTVAVHPTPIGDMLLAARGDHLVRCHPTHGRTEAALSALTDNAAHALSVESTALLQNATTQLDEYFAGSRTVFALPLSWDAVRGFARDALSAVGDIPFGETASYGEVAVMAGRPRAARAVGTACASTPFSVIVPVHRVVRSDGSIGEYGGYPDIKRFLLAHESQASDARSSARNG